MFHNTEEFLQNSQETKHNSTNKPNLAVTEEENKKLNLIREWKTVKSKTSNINKVVENKKRFHVKIDFLYYHSVMK